MTTDLQANLLAIESRVRRALELLENPHQRLSDIDPEYSPSFHLEVALTNLSRHRASEEDHANQKSREMIAGVVTHMLDELFRALLKFPAWPVDPLHAAAIVAEEAGELHKAVLQKVYEPGKSTTADIHAEAVQVGAMAIRFILGMSTYEYMKSKQVSHVKGRSDDH